MALSRFAAKWMMNLYFPLLFNRIYITHISPDYKEVDVKIKKSWMNRNTQGTIFGGTLFSAADPFYSLMYWQLFIRRGLKMEAWVRGAEADFRKAGATDLMLRFRITEEDVKEAEEAVKKEGRFKKWHAIQITDTLGEICAEIKILVYIRSARGKEKSVF